MPRASRHLIGRTMIALAALAALPAPVCRASAIVQGAYYQLGDADPSASAGSIGNDPTIDSSTFGANLSRFGGPRYSSDVPARGPAGDKLSMQFANVGIGGPAVPAWYGRTTSLSLDQQGQVLEAWAKAAPTNLQGATTGAAAVSMIAYDGTPSADGFGLYQDGDKYVARVGTFERVLGPADAGAWHHLAYVRSSNDVGYYYDGKLVAESTADPLPASPTGGFHLGGTADGGNGVQDGFNGWIDEVRFQSFNPAAAGAFSPTDFLIAPAPAPEPASLALAAAGLGLLMRRTSRARPRSAR